MEVYGALHLGRQSYVRLTKTLLEGVETRVSFNGEEVFRGRNPVLTFPSDYGLVPLDSPGQTIVEFETPVGTTSVVFKTTDRILESSSVPYVEKHLIAEESDFRIVQWILDHSRIMADCESFVAREEEIGQQGLTIGELGRIPFQRILLDFLGEERSFYLMIDNPKLFRTLLDQLSEIDVENLDLGLESPALMLEYGDNFDGEITNPNLFKEYCLPSRQGTRKSYGRRHEPSCRSGTGNRPRRRRVLFSFPSQQPDFPKSLVGMERQSHSMGDSTLAHI
jgi:hypothetical protein